MVLQVHHSVKQTFTNSATKNKRARNKIYINNNNEEIIHEKKQIQVYIQKKKKHTFRKIILILGHNTFPPKNLIDTFPIALGKTRKK